MDTSLKGLKGFKGLMKLGLLGVVLFVAAFSLVFYVIPASSHNINSPYCTTTDGFVVCTDEEDYGSGDSVHLQGNAFAASTSYIIRVTRPDGSIVTGDGTFGSWPTAYDTVTTDEEGMFEYDYILNGIRGLYHADVLDADSNIVASHEFTDDAPFPTLASATYNSGTGVLNVTGTYNWTGCSSSKRIGYAIFINGATPVVPGAGSLDGVNTNTMHIVSLVSCANSGSFSDQHVVASQPSSVCVVMYDVAANKIGDSGGKNDIPAGSNRNTDNSYEENGNSYLLKVIDGRLDINKDGSADNDDDGFSFGFRIIDGRVDINDDGIITGADDGVFNGKTVINGEIDFNGSGTISGADDGTFTDPNTCPTITVVQTPVCGDGVVNQQSEQCDDGNQNNADTCNNQCQLTVCGDNVKQTPNGQGTGGPQNDGNEACDGNDGVGQNQACSGTCTIIDLPFCGNSVIDNGEQCDDGKNGDNTDTCTDSCTLTFCGDIVVQTPNGVGTGGPQDDGNEACDKGPSGDNTCTNSCELTFCGDNTKQTPNGAGIGGPQNDGNEACDGTDGVGQNQECSETCTLIDLPFCGDGVKNGQEECDGDDGVGPHQLCSQSCELVDLTYCGDGIKQTPNDELSGGPLNNGNEACDDGNLDNDDGCSNTCTINNPELEDACGLDIVLIMDSSGSISSSELTIMKTAFKDFVDIMLPGTPTEIAVVDFDSLGTLTQDYTSNVASIKSAIDSATSGGFTNWEDGLKEAFDEFDNRADKPDLYIFASDGNPNRVGDTTSTSVSESAAVAAAVVKANQIKLAGIRIITVGIGSGIDSANMKAISSADAYVEADDFDDLAATLGDIAQELCGGTITVKKLVGGQPASGWEFTISGASATPNPGTTDGTGFVNFDIDIPDTTVTVDVTETLQNGYELDVAACTLNNNPIGTFDNVDGVNGIQLGKNDIVFCQFENSAAECGDGVVNQESEQCDDGNQNDWDACSNTCLNNKVLTVTATPAGAIGGTFKFNVISGTCQDATGTYNTVDTFVCRQGSVVKTNLPQNPVNAYVFKKFSLSGGSSHVIVGGSNFTASATVTLSSDATATIEYEQDLLCPLVEVISPPDSNPITWHKGFIHTKATVSDPFPSSGVKEARVDFHNIDHSFEDPPGAPQYLMFYNATSGFFEYHWDTNAVLPDTCVIIQADVFGEDFAGNGAGNQCADTNQFGVDNAPPVTEKTIGDPKSGNGYYVTTSTPITLTATDCGIGVDYIYVEIWWDSDNDGVVDTKVETINTTNTQVTFDFDEESIHEIRWYAVDKLGNKEQMHFQEHAVDDTPPEITKLIEGPWFGACPPQNEDVCFIDGVTKINVSAVDPQPHPSDEVSCNWSYTVDGGQPVVGSLDEDGEFLVWFPEETTHVLTITCEDALGNDFTDVETFHVDKTPPVTTKTYGEPNVPGQYLLTNTNYGVVLVNVHYITPATPITLSVDDAGPHKSGIAATYFVVKVPYQLCNQQEDPLCQVEWVGYYDHEIYHDLQECLEYNSIGEIQCVPTYWRIKIELYPQATNDPSTWPVYEGPFVIPQESVHKICFYSVDNVNKTEEIHCQVAIVDNTPPVIEKSLEGPWYGDCPPGEEDTCFIDGVTNIIVSATDDEPHPVGGVTCDWDYQVLDGPKLGQGQNNVVPPFVINFPEESTHVLTITCEDALGNDFTDVETFFVDKTPPVTTKTYGEPFVTDGTYDWINQSTPITLTVEDAGPHKSGVDSVHWRVTQLDIDDEQCTAVCEFEGNGEWDWENGDEATFYVQQDSCHLIEFYSVDNVNKTEEENRQCVFVDTQAPEIEKDVGDPKHQCEEEENCDWYVNQSTPITFSCEDLGPHPVDQVSIHWRTRVADDCNDLDEEEWNVWQWFSGDEKTIKFNEDSCHEIEYFCKDALGNEGTHYLEVDVVDTQSPVTTKEVGDPKVVCELPDNNVGPDSVNVVSVGDLVHEIDVSTLDNPGYTAFCSVGLAFDGASLFYNRCGDENIYKIHPVTGALQGTFDTNVALKPNAMAYDATRNGIWFGTQGCSEGGMPVYFWDFDDDSVTLMFTVTSATINPATSDDFLGFCFLDGLAFNANSPGADDDELWFSDDINKNLGVFRPDGTFVTGFDASDTDSSLSSLSGLAIGGSNLYMGNNGGGDVFRANKDTLAFVDEFASTSDRVEDMECDPVTFNNEANGFKEVMWVRHTPQGSAADDKITAHEIEPGTCGFGGQPSEEQPPGEEPVCDYYITSGTSITFSCEDLGPHPVDHATVHWRVRFAEDCSNLDEIEWGPWQWSEGSEETNLPEDSCHEIEYFCKDALGNEEEHQFEVDIVDNTPPVITKEVVGPQIGDCPPENSEETCMINGVTEIHVDAVDQQPHPVGGVTCNWYYYVVGTEIEGGENGVTPPFVINFPEESEHVLTITCEDALGNEVEDIETFFVDKTPPVTTKDFEGPQYPDDGDQVGVTHWITSQTQVVLSAHDEAGPHVSGVNATYYRITLLEDDAPCNYETVEEELNACELAEGGGEWQLYTGPFTVPEDSCHLIEYYSVDNVDKTEEENRQCVFVDNKGPLPVKTVGEAKSVINHTLNWNDYTFQFYPEVNGLCFNATNGNAIDCWKVTTMTPITMACVDQEPHPVDHSTIWFKVDLDGEDATEQYCDEVYGSYDEETGYCFVESDEVIFHFIEESEHNLAFHCEDILGNVGPTDDEKFKVEGSNFEIQINKKWNLISVPFVLLSDSMDEVFGNPNSNIKSVWTYDPTHATCGMDWCVYTPDGNPGNDNLDSMVPGMGYWVLAANDTTLLIGGSLFSPIMTPPSKTIVPGWNLIGYYGNLDDVPGGNPIFSYSGPVGAGADAICALGTLVDTSHGHPKWASLWTYWEPYNTDGIPATTVWVPLGFFSNMDPGAGYWLEIDVAESYSPSTTCPLIV